MKAMLTALLLFPDYYIFYYLSASFHISLLSGSFMVVFIIFVEGGCVGQ